MNGSIENAFNINSNYSPEQEDAWALALPEDIWNTASSSSAAPMTKNNFLEEQKQLLAVFQSIKSSNKTENKDGKCEKKFASRPPWEIDEGSENEQEAGKKKNGESSQSQNKDWTGASTSTQVTLQYGQFLPEISNLNIESANNGRDRVGSSSQQPSSSAALTPNRRGGRGRYISNWEHIKFRGDHTSELKILLPKGHRDLDLLLKISLANLSNGYNAENCAKAMARLSAPARRLFVLHERKLFVVEGTRNDANLQSPWNVICVCQKTVSVPSLDPPDRKVKFEGRGMSNKEAENNCDIAILTELYNFDVIKEASVEINNPLRKDFLDPTRKLDLKTRAWLDSSMEKFVKKIRAIEARKELFY